MEEQDSIELTGGGGLSYKEIVLNQFRKITELCNVEFRGGFYSTFINAKGEEKHPNMVSKQHTITAKGMGMVCACVCGHDSEEENTHHVKRQICMACACGVA